jgi:phospholipid-binding lipoprotein MlaA
MLICDAKGHLFRIVRDCLLAMLCLSFFSVPQAKAHAKNSDIYRPAGWWYSSAETPGTGPALSPLPTVPEIDPGIELAKISRREMEKMGHHKLVVAMRLGEELDLFSGSSPASPMSGDTAFGTTRDPSRVSGLGNTIQLGAASFEDEKIVEEPEDWNENVQGGTIADPLEPINRAFFTFNDKLYFWVLKPVARGYRYVIPEPFRVGIRNMFTNFAMPIRAVNCLLQGKISGFGRELLRFAVNSTVGFLGFVDVGSIAMHVDPQDEDFGQTLGFFGAGPGIFIEWPIFGPSSIRDTFGLAGDFFADPLTYLVPKTGENIAVRGEDKVNRTSLSIGDYEALKKSALDPYVAVRDAYFQYRRAKIEK